MTTPSAETRDLEALVPVDITVMFGSPPVPYRIPGDMPMEPYLLAQGALAGDDEVQGTHQLHAALFKLFTWYLPDTPEHADARAKCDVDVRRLGVRTMLRLINGIYADDEDEAGEAGEGAEVPPSSTAIPTTTGLSPNGSSQTPAPPEPVAPAGPTS